MLPRSVVITGSNRGLGLEFVKQLISAADPPEVIFAACRDPDKASDLQSLAKSSAKTKVHVCQFDVVNDDQLESFVSRVQSEVGENGLNLLINNAGMYDKSQGALADQTSAGLMKHFHVNAVAPIMVTKAFLPLLKIAGAKNPNPPLNANRAGVVTIGTKMASMDDNTSGGSYPYRTSKVAAHMAMRNLAHDLTPLGILALLLHPGWVRTDMGGAKGWIDTTESVSGMMAQMKNLTEKEAGICYDYAGRKVPF